MPKRSLTAGDAVEIKRRLDAGDAQRTIAEDTGTTQPQIAKIFSGELYPEARWPDGTQGPHRTHRAGQRMQPQRAKSGRMRSSTVMEVREAGEEVSRRIRDLFATNTQAIEDAAAAAELPADVVQEALEKAEAEFERAFLEAGRGSGEEVEDPRPLPKGDRVWIPWNRLAREGCPWVLALSEEEQNLPEGHLLKGVIEEVLALLDKGYWDSGPIERLLLEAARLRGSAGR